MSIAGAGGRCRKVVDAVVVVAAGAAAVAAADVGGWLMRWLSRQKVWWLWRAADVAGVMSSAAAEAVPDAAGRLIWAGG